MQPAKDGGRRDCLEGRSEAERNRSVMARRILSVKAVKSSNVPSAPLVCVCVLAQLGLWVLGTAEAQTVVYVDDDAAGANDGSSWCDAYLCVQDALDAARDSGGSITEIRVAEGTYTPDQGAYQIPGDRSGTFEMISGVALKGGYAGCGAPDPDARDYSLYETILSGDLNRDDDTSLRGDSDCCTSHATAGCDDRSCQEAVCEVYPQCCDSWWREGCAASAEVICCELCRPLRCENSYNVVTATETDATALLDGFVVTSGEANGAHDPEAELRFVSSGGLYIYPGGSPTISNCTFHDNTGSVGSAIYTSFGRPTVHHCTFAENGWYAGGPPALHNWAGELAITDSHFINNRGAGLVTMGSEAIVNCSFVGNVNEGTWGAGLALVDGAPNIIGCAFISNEGLKGGGMYNGGHAQLVNCVFYGNSAGYEGGGLFSDLFGPILVNCIFSGNTAGGYMEDPWSTPDPGRGGGVALGLGGALVLNSTFVGNRAGRGGGMATASAVIDNSVFWDNSSDDSGQTQWGQISHGIFEPPDIDFCCVQGWTGSWGGEGNVGLDPLFVDSDGPDDIGGTEDDNLRLSANSPLINAGDPDPPLVPYLDADGHERILCGRVDMGAYEFGIGDYDCNSLVELIDFAAWAACMTGPDNGPFDAGCEAFDFDASVVGDIDLKDFAGFQRTLTDN